MGLIRLLFFALIIYVGLRLFKAWGRSLFKPSPPDDRSEHPADSAELIQDPQCGAFFLKQRGVTASVGGRLMHFCSPKCRDAYEKQHGGS